MSLTVPTTARFVPLPTGTIAMMAKHYTPFSIRESIKVGTVANGCEAVPGTELKAMRLFFDIAGPMLRMYSTPEELWDYAKDYIDFQGNNKYFQLDPSTHYNHTLRIFSDVHAKKEFIQKNDIFLYIQNFLLQKETTLKLRLPLIMLTYYFKSEEKKLGDTCEFVVYEKEEFKKLEYELIQLLVKMKTPGGVKHPSMQFNWKKVFIKFQKLLPVAMKESEMSVLGGVLKALFSLNQCNRQQASGLAILMYTYCSALIPGLQKIIGSRPQWFLPNCKLDPEISASIKPVVRVFQYNNSRYLLTKEVEIALGNTSETWKDMPNTSVVEVLEYEDATVIWKGYAKSVEDTDFILIPTISTKHCFIPIQDGTGLFCKPAVEALLEMLDDLFFSSNVFEAPNKKTADTLTTQLNQLSNVFFPEAENVVFIDHHLIRNTNGKFLNTFLNKLNKRPSPCAIRDVSSNGFTSEDIHEELKYLQVDVYLTDVCDYAELAFQKVQADKMQKTLRTCDMYDAVRICMLLSLFKKFPKLAKFVHSQKACHRIHGHQCTWCEKEKMEPKKTKKQYLTFYSRSEVSPTSNNDTRVRINKIIKMNICNDDTLDLIEEDLTPVHPTPKPVEKPPKVKKEKEATTCEKCIRTNERCQKAKDEKKECKKRMEDIGAEMNILKYSISNLKEKEAELQKAVEEKYGNRLALVMEELSKLKEKEEQDSEKIQKMKIQVVEQEKELEAFTATKHADDREMKDEMEESNELLRNTNKTITARNLKKDEKIQKLKEEIKAIRKSKATYTSSKPCSTYFVSTSNAAPSKSKNFDFNPPLIAQMLHDFQKMKEDLGKSNFLRHARTKVNELINLSDDDQVKNTAKFELDRVSGEFKTTLKKLEENIDVIEKNSRIPTSKLHKIKRPAFSPHFLEEYNRAIAKKNQPVELDDTECLICIQNMEPEEATVKCSKCRRRYHTECASHWLSTKTVCPTCDRAMLHPVDYPPLN